MSRRAAMLVLGSLGLGLSGCAVPPGPAGGASSTTASSTVSTAAGAAGAAGAVAPSSNEQPSPPGPPAQTTSPGSGDPQRAVEAFIAPFINWDAQSVVGHLQALAGQSIGQARSAMALAAAKAAGDYELVKGGIANHGTIEAIAPLMGLGAGTSGGAGWAGGAGAAVGAGSVRRYAVVTVERTTAAGTGDYTGLRPAWHVALVTVTDSGGTGWVVSGWQPES